MSAVDYARNAPGVSVVSMSWGVSEFDGESAYDGYFTTPAGHTPVAFVASSGDSGAADGPYWPAVSANVLSVGGTTMSASGGGQYIDETAWSGSGNGVSTQEAEPPYQEGVQSTGERMVPDVAYNADPNTGFSVYDSIPFHQLAGWQTLGGTSAGAPQWAGLIAEADQARAADGKDAIGDAAAALYSLPSSDFHNMSNGAPSGAAVVPATVGNLTNGLVSSVYETQTGLGSPVANDLIMDLAGSDATLSAAYDLPNAILSPIAPPASKPASPPGAKPLDGSDGNGDDASSAAAGAAAAESTDASQTRNFAVTVVSASGTSAAAAQLTPAQLAAVVAVSPSSSVKTSTDSGRIELSLHPAPGSASVALGSMDGENSTDSPSGQQDGLSISTADSQFHLNWTAEGQSSKPRAKSASGFVQAPVLTTKRRQAEGDDEEATDEEPDSLQAIDHCFASGVWIEQVLAAHPDADLPGQLLDPTTLAAVSAKGALPPEELWAIDTGSVGAKEICVAAAVAAGAYLQLSRKAADAGGPPARTPMSDFFSLSSRFRAAKLAWASSHRSAKSR
jgi:hypothetical protein